MVTLHLGVIDIPYAEPSRPQRVAKAKRGKANKPRKPRDGAAAGTVTTGDVAQILEDKYGIMQTFVDRHLPDVADDLAQDIAALIEGMMKGEPPSANPFNDATSALDAKFKRFLDDKEMDGLPGVPTKAAIDGVNHRLKHPHAKGNPGRPSFIDTGLYQTSFRAWVDES